MYLLAIWLCFRGINSMNTVLKVLLQYMFRQAKLLSTLSGDIFRDDILEYCIVIDVTSLIAHLLNSLYQKRTVFFFIGF
jgi:hypothetical protein